METITLTAEQRAQAIADTLAYFCDDMRDDLNCTKQELAAEMVDHAEDMGHCYQTAAGVTVNVTLDSAYSIDGREHEGSV